MNHEQTERLAGCFRKVFPRLSRAEIETASHANTAAWDSVVQVTLISLIGEEFGVELDFEEFEEATSYAAFHSIVGAKLSEA